MNLAHYVDRTQSLFVPQEISEPSRIGLYLENIQTNLALCSSQYSSWQIHCLRPECFSLFWLNSNAEIAKARPCGAKIDKFHTDCFFIGHTWAGDRICPNLKSDLAAKDPGLQCALSTTPASSEIWRIMRVVSASDRIHGFWCFGTFFVFSECQKMTHSAVH